MARDAVVHDAEVRARLRAAAVEAERIRAESRRARVRKLATTLLPALAMILTLHRCYAHTAAREARAAPHVEERAR